MSYQIKPTNAVQGGCPTSCPACGGASTVSLGRPKTYEGLVNLVQLDELYECQFCSLLFRHPYLTATQLDEFYSQVSVDTWTYLEGRPDHQLAVDIIRKAMSSGNILDVGCFRGDFLISLPDRYGKYGTEMSSSAREVARQKGVVILGQSVEQLERVQESFRVITLLDVIEHLPRPMQALEVLAHLLEPGGLLIISTGDTSTLPWRLSRLDYWYYYPEHVTFFNPRWFDWAVAQLEVKTEVIQVERFSHYKTSLLKRWFQGSQCLAYAMVRKMNRKPRIKRLMCTIYPFNRVGHWSSPPRSVYWRDHMLVVLKRL